MQRNLFTSALRATYSVSDLQVCWCTIYRCAQTFQHICRKFRNWANFRTTFI